MKFKKKYTYAMIKFLSILGFTGSLFFTVMLSLTMAQNTIDIVLGIIIGLVLQVASFLFLSYKQYGIAIILFTLSIFATTAFQYNVHNMLMNESFEKSETYSNFKENREAKKNIISTISDDKQSIKDNFNRTVSGLNEEKKSLQHQISTLEADKKTIDGNRALGAWHRAEQKKSIDKEINNINQRISKINGQISTLNEKMNNDIANINKTILGTSKELENNINIKDTNIKMETKGYLGISEAIADIFGVSASTVVLVIQIIIAVVFEYTAIRIHMLADKIKGASEYERRTSNGNNNNTVRNNTNTSTVNTNTDVVKKKISASSEIIVDNEITDIDIQKYLKACRDLAGKTGKCAGYKKTGARAGIKQGKAEKIRLLLIEKGILEYKHNNTWLKGA